MARVPLLALLLALVAIPLGAVEMQVLKDGTPAKLTVLGNASYMRGQYDTAIAHYQQALELDRTYFYALFNLGLTSQQLAGLAKGPEERNRQLIQAQNYFLDALRQRPDNAEVHSCLGLVAYRLGDLTGAIGRFQAAVDASSNPHEKAGYAFNLGTACEAKEDAAAARRAYEQCLQLDDRHYEALYNLGSLHLRLKNYKQAEGYLLQAREVAPQRAEPLLNLAVLTESRGTGDPLPLYNDAVQVASAHQAGLLPRALWHRARFYERATIPGVPTKVRMKEDLLALLAIDPAFPEANGLLGMYYEGLGQFDDAIQHLEREVAEGAFNSASEVDLESHFRLAIIYSEHRRNPAKALEHVSAYYRVRPDASGDALRERALNQGQAPVPKAAGGAKPAAAPTDAGQVEGHAPTAPAASPAPTAPAAPAPAPASGHGH